MEEATIAAPAPAPAAADPVPAAAPAAAAAAAEEPSDESGGLSPAVPKKRPREPELEATESFEDQEDTDDDLAGADLDPRVYARAKERKRRMKDRQRQADEKRRREEARRLEEEVREEAKREKRRQSMLVRRKADAKKKKEGQGRAAEKKDRARGEKTAKQLEGWAQRRIEALLREQKKLTQQLAKASDDHRNRRRTLESTRYPVDDRLLAGEAPAAGLAERPVPVKQPAMEAALCTDAIVVWDFLRQFSANLELTLFSLDDFIEAVQHTLEPSVLLGEIFCTLARLVLSDQEVLNTDDLHGDALYGDFLPRKLSSSLADTLTYGEVVSQTLPLTHAYELLCEGLEVAEPAGEDATPRREAPKSKKQNQAMGKPGIDSWLGPALHSGVEKLRTAEPHTLTAAEKLAVLRCLCNASFETATVRNVVATNHAARLQICKRREDEDRAEAKTRREQKQAVTEQALEELAPEWAALHLVREKRTPDADGAESGAPGGEEEGASAAGAVNGADEATAAAPTTSAKKKKKRPHHGVPPGVLSSRVEELLLVEKMEKRYLVQDLGTPEDDEEGEETEDEDEDTLMLTLSRREMIERRQHKDKVQAARRVQEENRQMHADAQAGLTAALASENMRTIREAIRYAASVGLEGDLDPEDPRATPEVDMGHPPTYDAWICPELFEAKKALSALDERKRQAERRRRYDKELSQLGVRTEALGEDRAGRIYYLFPGDERVYIQEPAGEALSEPEVAEAKAVPSLDATDPGTRQVRWWYYDTEAETLQLVRALDVRGLREKLLKEALQAEFDVKLLVQSVEASKKEEVEWKTEGHDHIGARVRRRFGKQGVMDATIVGWLPAPDNEGLELWHIKHDDGDKEDLDAKEVEEALAAHAAAEAKRASKVGDGDTTARRPFTFYENPLRSGGTPAEYGVGLGGLKNWVVEIERSQVLPKLQELRSDFASSRSSDRRVWMDLLLNAERVGDVAQGVVTLEEAIHNLQQDEDVKDDDTDEEEEEEQPPAEPEDEDYETESEPEEGRTRSRRKAASSRASTPVNYGGSDFSSTLWPNGHAREAWRTATIRAATTAQVALSFQCLMDHAIDFGAAVQEASGEGMVRASRSRQRRERQRPDLKKLAPKWH